MTFKKKIKPEPESDTEIVKQPELYEEVKILLDKLVKKNSANPQEAIELFSLYNLAFNRSEKVTSCTSCVQRVYINLKAWFAKKTEEIENE